MRNWDGTHPSLILGKSRTDSSIPLVVLGLFFLLWGRWGGELGEGESSPTEQRPQSRPPAQLFSQLSQGSGSQSSLPKGSIWPAAPSGQLTGRSSDKESQGPGWALTRPNEIWGRLLVSWGDRSEENSSSGSPSEWAYCKEPLTINLHINFQVFFALRCILKLRITVLPLCSSVKIEIPTFFESNSFLPLTHLMRFDYESNKKTYVSHTQKISTTMVLQKLQKLDFSSVTKEYCKLQTNVIMKSCIAIRRLACYM